MAPFSRWGASYFLWRKESNQRKHFKSSSNLLSEAKPGFFDETSLSHRKTAHVLCAALWVYDQGKVCRLCKTIRTLPSTVIQAIVLSLAWFFYASKLQHLVRLSAGCQNSSNPYRPIDAQTAVSSDLAVDPEGDAQDVHRFSMRQGCLIEKSRLRLRL